MEQSSPQLNQPETPQKIQISDKGANKMLKELSPLSSDLPDRRLGRY
jgi:hypothetical protein